MTSEQKAKYLRGRKLMGWTASDVFRIATGKNASPSVELTCYPTRQPGEFCECLMSYADMLRIKPQLYFPRCRR